MSDVEHERRPGGGGGNGPSPMLIGLIVVAVAVGVFIFQNGDRSNVEFLMFDGNIRTWVVILVSVGAGILLDRFVSMWWRRSRDRN